MNNREDFEWSIGPLEVRHIEELPDDVEPQPVSWLLDFPFRPRLVRVDVYNWRGRPERPVVPDADFSVRVRMLGRRVGSTGKPYAEEQEAQIAPAEYELFPCIAPVIDRAIAKWHAANAA